MRSFGPGRRLFFFRCFLSLLFLASPGLLRAHSRTVSTSKWVRTPAGWEVEVRLPVLELDRRFGPGRWDPDAAQSFALEHFRVRTGEGPCARIWGSGSMSQDVYTAGWTLDCKGPTRTLVLDAFFDTAPSHLHLARVQDGGKRFEQVVTAAAPTFSLEENQPPGFARSFAGGIPRFLSGPARVCCLVGLALLAGSRRSLLKIVAVFAVTGAASLSLPLLGWVRVDPRSVNALVGLSVLVIAVELFIRWSPRPQAGRWRTALGAGLLLTGIPALLGWFPVAPGAILGVALIAFSLLGLDGRVPGAAIAYILAAVFGLIHGLGFAVDLGPIGRGAAGGSLPGLAPGCLFGAGSGVVAAVAGAYLFSLWLSRRLERLPRVQKVLWERVLASVWMAGGTYWFVGSAMGLG